MNYCDKGQEVVNRDGGGESPTPEYHLIFMSYFEAGTE